MKDTTDSVVESVRKGYPSFNMLTKSQVAEVLQVDLKTVYLWVKSGRFPAPAIIMGRPRWLVSDVDKYIRSQFAKAR